MVRLLLETEIDVSTRESTGRIELHCTAFHGRERSLIFCLKRYRILP